MALGAQASTVVRMVMARGLRLITYGGVLGLGGGLAASQLILASSTRSPPPIP